MLSVHELSVFYGDAQALDRVSLEVGANEIVALVGANGAGKTSLIRALSGILKPRSGSIRFEGREIAGLDSYKVCDLGIGQVAEGRQIFPSLSVHDNLEIGGLLPHARRHASEGIERVFTMFPRLKERSGQAAGTLSGGEQQMLAIARCLMGVPRLIMFDEPSLGLSPALVGEVFETLRTLHAQGMTILLVEQNVAASLKLANRAYVLENGNIVLEGTGMELLDDPRVREAYLGL